MKLILNQNKLNEELFEAICDGDLLKTKELIANGANVNSKHPDYDYNICPCLYKSIIEEYIDIVEILLNAGADPNIPACELIKDIEIFYYPIQAAVTTSNSSVAIVKLLIEHGLNLNSKFSQDAFLLICQNRFDHAIYMIECCRALIVAGIDLNYIDELEETALFLAATSNNIGITKLLIENGAKKNLASSFALDNYDEVTSIYQNSDKRVDNEAYILCKAVFFRNTTLIEKMLNFGVNINIPYQGSVGPKKTALTSTHNHFMREWLLKQGADPKVIIKTERANPLCDVIVSEDIEPFKLLLSSGADPNETSSDHTKTPILHLAVSYSSPLEKSKRLLFYGADIHAKDVLCDIKSAIIKG